MTIEGQKIGNAEDEVLGTVPFRTDFAQSCNTAFVGSRSKVSPQQLADAAAALGYGEADGLGVQAFGGQRAGVRGRRRARGGHDRARQGARQPADGGHGVGVRRRRRRVTPRLVVDPAPADAVGAGRRWTKGTVTTLQGLMRAVVTEGTGTTLGGVPGAPVHGKTGTAEFGTKNPPDTHAWFTGYQGDLGVRRHRRGRRLRRAGRGPIAADFLRRLH